MMTRGARPESAWRRWAGSMEQRERARRDGKPEVEHTSPAVREAEGTEGILSGGEGSLIQLADLLLGSLLGASLGQGSRP